MKRYRMENIASRQFLRKFSYKYSLLISKVFNVFVLVYLEQDHIIPRRELVLQFALVRQLDRLLVCDAKLEE